MPHVLFDEKWLNEYSRRTGIKVPEIEQPAKADPSRPKYGNRKTQYAGQVFDSMHEAEAYKELLLRVKAGDIRAVACQVPFLLPGGVMYIADFVTMGNDGTYTVMDAKSEATRKDKVYRLKKRQMRECLGIEIQEV